MKAGHGVDGVAIRSVIGSHPFAFDVGLHAKYIRCMSTQVQPPSGTKQVPANGADQKSADKADFSHDKGCRVLAVFVHFLPLRVDDCISGVRFPFFCSALTVSNCWLVGRLLLVTMLPREREREREIYHLFAHMPVLLEFCGFLICLVAFLITSSCTKRPMCNLRS